MSVMALRGRPAPKCTVNEVSAGLLAPVFIGKP